MSNPLYEVSPGLLRKVKRLFGNLRVSLFTKEYDKSRADVKISGDASIRDIEVALGNENFTNAWELSWHYKGEKLNMRRPKRYDDEYEWYQTHVRAFLVDDVIHLEVHEDLEPTEYPYYHLHPPEDSSVSDIAAVEDLGVVLNESGIEFETL